MKYIMALLLASGALLATACQMLSQQHSHFENDGRQVLVTFAQPAQSSRVLLGAKLYYQLRDEWRAPLNIRPHINRLKRKHALVELDGWPISSLNMFCVVFRVAEDREVEPLLAELHTDPGVLIAQPMNYFRGLTRTDSLPYDDPYIELQYGERIDQLSLLHGYTQGADVSVGIIDSPIDRDHPDLAGQFQALHNFVAIRAQRDLLHGTAVAGVIAAISNNGRGGAGLAPKATLYSYGACTTALQDDSPVCNSFDLAKALEHAIDDAIDVLNLSLAGPPDPLLAALLDHAIGQGMIVVAARNGENPGENFPASHRGVIAAGNPVPVAKSGAAGRPLNWFEAAERLSTRAGGGYQYFYGSSISSAGMTGMATLVRSRFSAPETRHLLNSVAEGDCSRFQTAAGHSRFEHAIGDATGCLPAIVPGIASKHSRMGRDYEDYH